MKKLITVTLVFVLLLCIASCGSVPDGVYYSGDIKSGTYKKCDFDGDEIVIEIYVDGKKIDASSVQGEYEIDENRLTIYVENDDGECVEIIKPFEIIDEKSIKIDSFIYYSTS